MDFCHGTTIISLGEIGMNTVISQSLRCRELFIQYLSGSKKEGEVDSESQLLLKFIDSIA